LFHAQSRLSKKTPPIYGGDSERGEKVLSLTLKNAGEKAVFFIFRETPNYAVRFWTGKFVADFALWAETSRPATSDQ